MKKCKMMHSIYNSETIIDKKLPILKDNIPFIMSRNSWKCRERPHIPAWWCFHNSAILKDKTTSDTHISLSFLSQALTLSLSLCQWAWFCPSERTSSYLKNWQVTPYLICLPCGTSTSPSLHVWTHCIKTKPILVCEKFLFSFLLNL
jgi:hypothetical protein